MNSALRMKNLGLLTVVGVLIYFGWQLFSFDSNIKNDQYELCESKKFEEFNGIVSEVYVSWKSDTLNVFTFKLIESDSERIIYNYCLVYPEAVIEIGDSIFKVKDEFEYHIFKGKRLDSEIVISCGEDYCEKWK
jgi:hypothetical protein